jgi:uncharacterized Zn-binding protein involved in type VI secretion
MPAVQTDGDSNSAGGVVSGGSASVRVNGKPVTLEGNPVSSHAPWGRPHPPHDHATTTDASPTVFADGEPVLRIGSGTSCGHSIAEGSGDIFVP